MDIGENEKATQEPESSNVNFGKNPSAKLNSSFMLFKSEDITPGEKLVKALHVLARYRGVWGIYEDETQIMKHLTNLNRVLVSIIIFAMLYVQQLLNTKDKTLSLNAFYIFFRPPRIKQQLRERV